MDNLWPKEFKTLDITAPKDILEEQCGYLKQLTGDKIIARVAEVAILPFSLLKKTQKGLYGEKFFSDRKDALFNYEYFITSIHTPNYKFQIMYLSYGIPYYPLFIQLDESIGEELNNNKDISGIDISTNHPAQIVINSQEEFILILSNVLASKKVTNVINTLLTIANKTNG